MSSWRIIYLHFHNALVFSLSYFGQVCTGKLAQLLRAIGGFGKYIDVLISWYYKTKHWLGKKISDLIQNGTIYDQAGKKNPTNVP